MQHRCSSCSKTTEVCYTDGGIMGMVHGDCQCRGCYAKIHPECPSCNELTDKLWLYCAHCGSKLKGE